MLLRQLLPSFRYATSDILAGIVVFLVALPLCLGIALASGAPLMSGLIAGIIGGTILALFSDSELSVSGPAAGLAVVVLGAINTLGGFQTFLAAVVVAGVIQIILGWVKAGVLAEYVPNSVIRGMLAGIGVVIILKQVRHLIGWSNDIIDPGSAIVGGTCLTVLLVWDLPIGPMRSLSKKIPGPLVAVGLGTLLSQALHLVAPAWAISDTAAFVQIPTDVTLFSMVTLPSMAAFAIPQVWLSGAAIALIASIETLMSIEATDKLDPLKRISDSNQELRAQGIGNVVSGLVGGLPLTAVIIRSSTNVYAGGMTRLSAMIQGLLILISILLVPEILNLIPLAALAAVLVSVGYKLTSLTVLRNAMRHGLDQSLPFIATIIAVVLTDLLTGIGIGLLVSMFWVIRNNLHSAVSLEENNGRWIVRLNKDALFVNKSELKRALRSIPSDAQVTIDGTLARMIDRDIYETIQEFAEGAEYRSITVDYVNVFGKRTK
ncbi:MAG: SulP family inorganic anion transporter [Candidatus Kapaibacteriota bacterium]